MTGCNLGAIVEHILLRTCLNFHDWGSSDGSAVHVAVGGRKCSFDGQISYPPAVCGRSRQLDRLVVVSLRLTLTVALAGCLRLGVRTMCGSHLEMRSSAMKAKQSKVLVAGVTYSSHCRVGAQPEHGALTSVESVTPPHRTSSVIMPVLLPSAGGPGQP